jgi:hypothetical protein
MRSFLNQHSFLVVALVALAIAWVATRGRRRRTRIGVVAGLVAVAAVAFAVLRTAGGDVDLDRALARGRPVALEFYSNY